MLIALIISLFAGINLDGIMGAAVAVFILISGIGLIKDTLDPLLGKAPSAETVEAIRQKILAYDGVLGTHDLMIHDYGPGRMFASVHVEVSDELTLTECHDIIDRIERDFLESGLNMLVHPDPVAAEDILALDVIVHEIDERITVHDVRVVGSQSPSRVIFDCVLPPNIAYSKSKIQQTVTRKLQEKFPECEAEITFDDGYASIPKTGAEK